MFRPLWDLLLCFNASSSSSRVFVFILIGLLARECAESLPPCLNCLALRASKRQKETKVLSPEPRRDRKRQKSRLRRLPETERDKKSCLRRQGETERDKRDNTERQRETERDKRDTERASKRQREPQRASKRQK